MFGSFSGIAGGNITPSRFVKKTEVSGEPVLTLCGAGEDVYGIAQPSTRRMALTGWDDGYAAISGETFNVIGPGDDEGLLELGGTVAAGGFIKSGTSGVGVAATTDKDNVGARAIRGGVSGDLIPVKPMRFDRAI